MRAGLFLAYWPWFSPEEQVSLAVLADELGLDSVWISEAWGQDAVSVLGLLAGRTERIGLGSGLHADPGAAADRGGDGGRLAGRAVGRALPARARRVGPAGVRGLVRRAVRAASARTREYVEIVRLALGAPDRELRGARVDAAAARRARPAAEAAGAAGAGARPDLPRRGRPEGGRADGRDRGRLAAVHARPGRPGAAARAAGARAGRGGAVALGDRRRALRADGAGRGRRRGARRGASVARVLPRRDGRAGEELLRRAGRARRARCVGARVPAALPRGLARRRGGGAVGRADRRDGDRDDAGGARRSTGRVRARGCRHAGSGSVRATGPLVRTLAEAMRGARA